MRAIFGVLGLLIVVAIVGMLAKKQLSAGVAPASRGSEAVAPAANPQQQVQQFQQAVQGTMQARPMPENDK